MTRLFNPALVTILCCGLFLLSFPSHVSANPQGTTPSPPPAATNASTAAPSSNSKSPSTKNGGASASDIAAAKASGKVWVNTDTGVYHKSGRWYGKTKTGRFMTAAEAKAAGYKEAKNQ